MLLPRTLFGAFFAMAAALPSVSVAQASLATYADECPNPSGTSAFTMGLSEFGMYLTSSYGGFLFFDFDEISETELQLYIYPTLYPVGTNFSNEHNIIPEQGMYGNTKSDMSEYLIANCPYDYINGGVMGAAICDITDIVKVYCEAQSEAVARADVPWSRRGRSLAEGDQAHISSTYLPTRELLVAEYAQMQVSGGRAVAEWASNVEDVVVEYGCVQFASSQHDQTGRTYRRAAYQCRDGSLIDIFEVEGGRTELAESARVIEGQSGARAALSSLVDERGRELSLVQWLSGDTAVTIRIVRNQAGFSDGARLVAALAEK